MLRKGEGPEGPAACFAMRPAKAVEDGLGAAHRGAILGCDGGNRYDAALRKQQMRPLLRDGGELKWYHGRGSRL